MERSDISPYLVHLIRGHTDDDAYCILRQILDTGALLGGTGYVRGGYRCVCFSEAPLAHLSPVLQRAAEQRLMSRFGNGGSHRQYRHPDGRGTTVPFHAGRDISPTTLREIARDIGLTVDEFLGGSSNAAQQGAAADERRADIEHVTAPAACAACG